MAMIIMRRYAMAVTVTTMTMRMTMTMTMTADAGKIRRSMIRHRCNC